MRSANAKRACGSGGSQEGEDYYAGRTAGGWAYTKDNPFPMFGLRADDCLGSKEMPLRLLIVADDSAHGNADATYAWYLDQTATCQKTTSGQESTQVSWTERCLDTRHLYPQEKNH